jgi:hypothetical protein
MAAQVLYACEAHTDQADCPDCLISFRPVFNEYGLFIHDGGSSAVSISFCPWCGTALGGSLRDRWFEELEHLGIDPSEDEVPDHFRDDRWWRT